MAPGSAPPLSAFTAAERRLIQRLRTPLAVQRFLNALAYNMEPPPGRATLRSFRGVVRHRTAHCLEAALVGRRHPRTARIPAARPQLRVDRSPRPRDLRLSPERPMGIRRAIARSRPARAQGGLRHATRAGAELCRPVRRLHRTRDRLRGGGSAHARRLRLETVGRATSGRSSACCSTIRTASIRSSDEHIDRLRRRYVEYRSASAASRSTTAGWIGGRRYRRSSKLTLSLKSGSVKRNAEVK